jgi:hypothetical protein
LGEDVPARVPDFFIIGAPKCGTSALAEYLRTHPGVFFCRPKEPFFYSADYAHRGRISQRNDYLALFAEAPAGALLGEGSTWYLCSEVAVPRILKDNPDARLIVMLREPVAMLRSLHAHQLRELDEGFEDLAAAWNAQAARAGGRQLPRLCADPKMLQYQRVCSLGEQLERLFATVRQAQVLVHIFEEFVADPKAGYERTLAFLGLPPDRRMEFPQVNPALGYRSRLLHRFAGHVKREWSGPYQALKRAANRVGLRPGTWVTQSNKRAAQKPALDARFVADLRRELQPAVEHVERLLGRRIEAWHRPA